MVRRSSLFLLFILAFSGCRWVDGTNQILPVVYLGWDENEKNQLYIFHPDKAPQRISGVANGVHDFALGPDGQSIVYSTMVTDGASQLWMTGADSKENRLLLTCHDAACAYPVWAADGRRLIYEKRPLDENGVSGFTQLWWLDTETGATEPVLEDEKAGGTGARFSPDGRWLSYVSPQEEGVIMYDLVDGRSRFVADEVGVPAAWSPASDQAVVPNLELVIIHGDEGDDHQQHTHDYQTATHLFRFEVAQEELQNLSGDQPVEDSVPAWSPDGEWIAFGRRFPGTAAGRQLWLMKSDGSEQRPLIDDPAVNHGPPLWSPDGRHLLFQRFEIGDGDDYPSIWILDLESGQSEELVDKAMQPVWLINN